MMKASIKTTNDLSFQVDAETEEELFKQSRELAVVDERNRMSREIHDTIAQGLTGVILQLEAAGDFTKAADPELRQHLNGAQS